MDKPDRTGKRLSKIRLIDQSSPILTEKRDPLCDDSPVTSSDLDYFGDTSKVKSWRKRQRRSKSVSRLRTYLQGSPDHPSRTLSSEEATESPSKNLSEAARKAKRRLSRSGSVFAQRSNARDSTTLLSNASSSKLLDTSDAEDPETIAARIKQRAQTDILVADNHTPTNITNDTQCDPVLPPIRRKSLYTPGIATRNASDILRKPVVTAPNIKQSMVSDADRRYYYNASHPEDSPLSCLAALKLPDDGRTTPSNLNIPNIGGFKLGTLHVTNGVTSPLLLASQPVSACDSPTLSFTDRDEYKTASEGSIEEGKNISAHQDTDHSKDIERVPELDYLDPLKFQESELSRSHHVSLESGAGNALDIANEYMAELSSSPFSKHAKMTQPDQDDESASLEAAAAMFYTPLPVRGPIGPMQKERNDIRASDSADVSLRSTEGRNCVCPPTRELCNDANANYKEESPWTCDSGYHSIVSVNDNEKTHTELPGQTYETKLSDSVREESRPIMPTNSSVSCPNVHEYCTQQAALADHCIQPVHISDKSHFVQSSVRKLQKTRPKSQGFLSDVMKLDSHLFTKANIPRVPSAMALRHAERLIDFPLLDHTYPSSEHVSVEESPFLPPVRPMPIRFPSPIDTSEKSISCSQRQPTCIQIIESGSRTAIFSSNTSMKSPEIVRSPSWSAFGRSSKTNGKKKLVKKAEEARRRLDKEEKEKRQRQEKERAKAERCLDLQSKDKTSRFRSISKSRGRSAERRTSYVETEGTIADFGTVAESLGCSPYDIATPARSNVSRAQNACHPHQLGLMRPRPRSFVGMDDLSASEFARAKSRSRQQYQASEVPGGGGPCSQTVFSDRDREIKERRRRSWASLPLSEERSIPYKSFNECGAPPIPALSPTREQSENSRDSDPVHARSRLQNKFLKEEIPSNLPGLWSNGSIEKKARGPESTISAIVNANKQLQDSGRVEWEAHRMAWRERRKSAGEALMTMTQYRSLEGDGCAKTVYEQRDSKDIPRKNVGSGTSPDRRAAISPNIAALVGRYEGGLHFGYERGCGLGGSAGTRDVGNNASRKGREVSQGHGLDLSDLPVFVAAIPR